MKRREFLNNAGSGTILTLAAALGLINTSVGFAAGDDRSAFDAKSLQNTLKILGASAARESNEISINAPDIAENGAVVPIEVSSPFPNTQSISLLAEKNPNALTSTYEFTEDVEPYVFTRIKMGETSNLIVLVKADDKFYFAKKEIKITLGGCGG
jgi:sulfur-oxidizing protein SoxY